MQASLSAIIQEQINQVLGSEMDKLGLSVDGKKAELLEPVNKVSILTK